MFFVLSKVIWLFIQPSNLLIFIGLAGVALMFTRRWWLGRLFASVSILAIAVAGFSPLGQWLILPLEQRFELPAVDVPAPDGIIVLSGSVDTVVSEARGSVALNETAERLTTFVSLARTYPNARLVVSGGNGSLFNSGVNEAAAARSLLLRAGLDTTRLSLEDRSRNTFENALYSRNMIDPASGERWLLVTSSFHMPRAVGCFRRVGFDVIAYPVDFRTRGPQDFMRPFTRVSEGLRRFDMVTREWVGLFAYWITGRTSAFFPRA